MEVKSLVIERRPSYDSEYPSQLVGLVTLVDSNGSQTIRLSNTSLSRLFNLITQDVTATARRNAQDVQRGLENAVSEPLLLAELEVPS